MKTEFPIIEETIDGEDYILMQLEVFHAFFNEMLKYRDVDKSVVDEINKRYEKATRIKKKRIRLKKEKQVSLVMFDILFF